VDVSWRFDPDTSPNCQHEFETFWRASINMSLGGTFTKRQMERWTHAKRPECKQKFPNGETLTIDW